MKKNIRIWVYSLLLLAGISGLNAQKIDAKAQQLLEAVSKNYKAKKNLYFKFTYETGSGKASQKQTGIFYSTPTQYRLNIMGNEQIFDGKKIYNISKEDQEITIAKPNGSEKALSPINYLEEYKKGYTVAYNGKNGGWEKITLTPNKENGIQKVVLLINAAKKRVEKIIQTSSKNEVTAIAITQYKENLSLNASVFSFDRSLYKNYLITEL